MPRQPLALPALLAVSGELNYTLVMSVKEQVLQAIQRLPDDIGFRDVTDQIALFCSEMAANELFRRDRARLVARTGQSGKMPIPCDDVATTLVSMQTLTARSHVLLELRQ